MEIESRTNLPLIKVWNYSGNPHIVKMKFFKSIVIPTMLKSKYRRNPKRGLEASMTELINLDREIIGNQECHEKYGTYLYGDFNDGPYVAPI
jgi:hypothetical protein